MGGATKRLQFVRNMIGVVVAVLVLSNAAFAIDNRQLDLVDRIFQSASLCWWKPTIVEHLMTFKLSQAYWDKMLEPSGFVTVRSLAEGIGKYLKRQGYADLAADEKKLVDKNNGKPQMEKFVEPLKSHFTFSVVAEANKCSEVEADLLKRYLAGLAVFFSKERWTPPSHSANFSLIMDSGAQDISVKVEGQGKQFIIIAPADKDLPDWESKMLNPIRRASQKQK